MKSSWNTFQKKKKKKKKNSVKHIVLAIHQKLTKDFLCVYPTKKISVYVAQSKNSIYFILFIIIYFLFFIIFFFIDRAFYSINSGGV